MQLQFIWPMDEKSAYPAQCNTLEKATAFVTDHPLQFALREWRQHVTQPTTLIVLAGVGVVLGLVGPFQTDQSLRLVPRIMYWLVITATTYFTGYLVGALVEPALKRLGRWPAVGLAGVVMGMAISGVVVIVNLATLGHAPSALNLPQLIATVTAIACVVNVVMALLTPPQDAAQQSPHARLLDRLPLDKRAPLVALSVEDHYTRVITLTGEELLLMRLSDAIRETTGVSGAQVHRSHWAAFDQIVSARRNGNRVILKMTTGLEVPVSRANVDKIKEAGFLPR